MLPWELASAVMTAMAVYGFERLRRRRSSACSRSRSASTSCCCARCSRARRTRRRSSAGRTSSTSATRACSGCCWRRSRCAIPSAARHAAAVAHYAHQLARAAGLSEREQAIVHTAGLLHDLGKEALPDHILIGRSELHPAELRLIKRHPADGARLLLRVEGMGEVAAAVLAHHERIDGKGYPDGLAGDGIPMAARILAVAEVYDVLTAPDSYRIPMPAAEAEDELRRVAGSQLDGRLVWLFATQVLRGRHSRPPRAHRRPRGRAAGPARRPWRARRAVRARPAPPTDEPLRSIQRDGEPPGQQRRSRSGTRGGRGPTQPSKPNTASRTSSTRW